MAGLRFSLLFFPSRCNVGPASTVDLHLVWIRGSRRCQYTVCQWLRALRRASVVPVNDRILRMYAMPRRPRLARVT